MSLKPYLQLVRLPNVFTAAADSLAGWLIVSGTLGQAGRWLPLVGASMVIYAAGIALNDLFDVELDREERPDRPLPSGRVSVRFAAGLSVTLLALGLALSALSGSWTSLAVAGVLVACVVAYDSGLRKTPMGPMVMGACRGLNLLLGMSQAPALGGPWGWSACAALALFVVGLTMISRSETLTGRGPGVRYGMIIENLALLLLVLLALSGRTGWGLGVLLAVMVVLNRANLRTVREPSPQAVQRAVKTAVFTLIWLDVGLVASVRGPGLALAVASLWAPAFVLGKWLYST